MKAQVNVLELSYQKNFSQRLIYKRYENKASEIQIYVDFNNPKNREDSYTYFLSLVFSDISKYQLNKKIDLKSNIDSITPTYDFMGWKVHYEPQFTSKGDGTVEILELTDSTLKISIEIYPLNRSGEKLINFYKGERSFIRELTQKERVLKLVSLGSDSLINRFNSHWELLQTGKAYWIGYTDEMYAIASKKDSAINKLVNYINTTKNEHGKIGAVYCLHLIGINSTVVGRFEEEFIDINARIALLNLVFQKDVSPLVVSLLARDPWPSDLPVLYNLLQISSDKTLINALFRYLKTDMPFRESIAQDIDTFNVRLKDSTGCYPIGRIVTVYSENENEPQIETTKKKHKSFKSGDFIGLNGPGVYTNKANQLNQNGDVFIQFSDSGRIVRKFIPDKEQIGLLAKAFNCSKNDILKSKCETVNILLYKFFLISKEKDDVFSYCSFNEDFFHYIDSPNEIIICDLKATRQRLLYFLKNKNLQN